VDKNKDAAAPPAFAGGAGTGLEIGDRKSIVLFPGGIDPPERSCMETSEAN